MDIAGKRITLYGRFLLGSRAAAAATVEKMGGIVERELTRRTAIFVVGRGARALIPSGQLQRKLQTARAQGVPVVGEVSFLASLEGRADAPPTFPLTRLDPTPPDGLTELLSAFDIVHVAKSACRFADVEPLRAATRLSEAGQDFASIVEAMLQAEVAPAGRRRIVAEDGQARLQWEDGITGLDGQGLLGLDGQPGLDDLFEAATLAEAEGRLDDAARHYETCAAMDRRDPIAPFNLGNVLAAQGQTDDAIRRFAQAVARDPDFLESYYNRARAYESAGDFAAAERDLREALARDPRYVDALFNLAQLRLRLEDGAEALELYDRFLALDLEPKWRRIASKARIVAEEHSKKLRGLRSA